MPNLNITPRTVLLTSGQAVTFEATDAENKPVSVTWSLSPSVGNLAAPTVGTPAPSATFVAPSLVPGAQSIAIVASTASDSASATIALTSDAIAISPAKVELKAGEKQKFNVVIAGDPTDITWVLSPPLGNLDSTGLYAAPDKIQDTRAVSVIAVHPALARQSIAAVSLISPPWKGPGVYILAGYIFLVFWMTFLMMGLWPPALPSPDTAKANRIEAEQALNEQNSALEKAEIALAEAQAPAAQPGNVKAQGPAPATPGGANTTGNTATFDAAAAKVEVARSIVQRVQDARDFAANDLNKKRKVEETVNDPSVDTKLAGHINRELDLLWLVLLAGSLGSFLHLSQSYSAYVGNQTIKSSWASWYAFQPFIGAALALVFYASIRGGVIAIATGSNAKASELNPFGLVGVSALVGMFSRDATIKLGEVFATLFKTDKASESKDKLVESSQTSQQPTSGATGSTATK